MPVKWIDEVLDIALERPLAPAEKAGDIKVAKAAGKAPARRKVRSTSPQDVKH